MVGIKDRFSKPANSSLRIVNRGENEAFIRNRYTLDGRLVSKLPVNYLGKLNKQRVSGVTISVLKNKNGKILRVKKIQTVR
jgi:hypothetical protein